VYNNRSGVSPPGTRRNAAQLNLVDFAAPPANLPGMRRLAQADDDERQYSLGTILLIWAAAALPMFALGWVATPLVGDRLDLGVGDENREAFTRGVFLTLGLIWQFVVVLFLVSREEGSASWAALRRRCWLQTPRDPRTAQPSRKLWWWLIPLMLATALLELAPLQELWEAIFPFLDEPDRYSFARLLESDERKDAIEGAWHIIPFFAVLGLFNTVIGEELLFRGILLPRMRGVFGRRDWVANGILFGLYHLHQPWSIISATVQGVFLLAWPSRRFRSSWFGVVVHSGQTVFFVVIATLLVLGAA
jgi:uncharacterized protein